MSRRAQLRRPATPQPRPGGPTTRAGDHHRFGLCPPRAHPDDPVRRDRGRGSYPRVGVHDRGPCCGWRPGRADDPRGFPTVRTLAGCLGAGACDSNFALRGPRCDLTRPVVGRRSGIEVRGSAQHPHRAGAGSGSSSSSRGMAGSSDRLHGDPGSRVCGGRPRRQVASGSPGLGYFGSAGPHCLRCLRGRHSDIAGDTAGRAEGLGGPRAMSVARRRLVTASSRSGPSSHKGLVR